MPNIVFLFPRRCAPLIAPSSRFATPNPSFQKEGTTLGAAGKEKFSNSLILDKKTRCD